MTDHPLPSYIPEDEDKEALQKMDKRTRARIVAFQMCVQDDANPQEPDSDLAEELDEGMIRDTLRGPKQVEMAMNLINGVRKHKAEIDEKIVSHAENWTLARMALTDRNALRVGAFELLYTDTPAAIVINEAVEIAKMFGSENSAAFVNGILDKIAKERQ